MSREADVMDFILQLIVDASLTTPPTTQRGYTSPEQLVKESAKLPFAQAFQPISASEELDFKQSQVSTDFSLQIFDVSEAAVGDTLVGDRMRDNVEALQLLVSRDVTLGGLVRFAVVSDYATLETLDIVEMTAAVVTVSYEAFDAFDTDGDIDLLIFRPEDVGLVFVNAADDIAVSRFILNGYDFAKKRVDNAAGGIRFDSGVYPGMVFQVSPTFPLAKRLRLQFHLSPDFSDYQQFDRINLTLFKTLPNADLFTVAVRTSADNPFLSGWNDAIIDLDNPESTTGDPIDWSDGSVPVFITVTLLMNFAGGIMTARTFTLRRLYYTRTDLR